MIACKHSIYLPSKNTTGLFSEQIKYLSSSALAQGLTMVRTLSKEGGDQRNCDKMTNPDLSFWSQFVLSSYGRYPWLLYHLSASMELWTFFCHIELNCHKALNTMRCQSLGLNISNT